MRPPEAGPPAVCFHDSMCFPRKADTVWASLYSPSPGSRPSADRNSTRPSTSPSQRMGAAAAAGFTYDGERFERNFADFEQKYGFHDMYTGGFYPFPTKEERWAFWSRYIWLNRYSPAPKPVYDDLLKLVRDKDYFVITTNVDHQFQAAGVDKKRLFYTQGDYGPFQCSELCCQETFDNRETVRQMVERQRDMRVPSDLAPRCPHCGRPMAMNLRCDDRFAEDEGWHRATERYESFLRTRQGQKLLFLELGVGYNTPVIIKYPFWRMTAANPRAVYALSLIHISEPTRH